MWAPLPSSESSQVEAGSSSRSGTSQQQQPWELVRNAYSGPAASLGVRTSGKRAQPRGFSQAVQGLVRSTQL